MFQAESGNNDQKIDWGRGEGDSSYGSEIVRGQVCRYIHMYCVFLRNKKPAFRSERLYMHTYVCENFIHKHHFICDKHAPVTSINSYFPFEKMQVWKFVPGIQLAGWLMLAVWLSLF